MNIHRLRGLFASLFAISCISQLGVAADGDLDTTYNTPTGFNNISFGASDNVYGGVLQPDGKLIVIGGARPVTNQELSVARFNANGTLDTAFGTSGKFSLDINPATTTDRGTCGGLQSDGKIIVGGYTRVGSGNDDYALIRLNTNGTLDTTFGTSGISKVDFNGGTDRANALVVLPDNSIVMTGISSDFNGSIDIDFSLAKFTPNGALDTSFDTDGKVTVDFGDQQDNGNGVTVQSDGKIVFCGQTLGTGITGGVVGRLTTTGALDTTFGGGDGLYSITNSVPYDLRDVKVQSDGKIIAVGSGSVSGQLDGLMLRLTSTGNEDTTFNTTGIRTFPFGINSDLFLSVLIQADGKYIAGGFWQNPTPNLLETVLVRVTSAGALDSGFGSGGIKQLALGSGNNRPAMIGQAIDGKILVALEGGTSSAENFLAARFHNTVAATTTTVTSLNRVNSATTNLSTVNWTLTFAAANTGVSASNFSLSGTASSGASVGNPTTANAGLTWNVPVTTGSTSGTLTLNLANATGTTPGVSTSLPFAGQSYTMDKTAPTIGIGAPSVSSINAGAGSVTYTVTYADTNFNASTLANGNITLNTTGTASGTVGVSGSGTTRTVTISSITGAGTLGISIASGTATDTAGNTAPAAGPSGTFSVVNVPGAPTIGAATAGNMTASVAFTAPGNNGGSVILDYTATSSPGGITATSATSPISVTGLTNGTPYTFTVTARNAVGSGAASAASNSVTPAGVPGAPTIGTATAGNATASVAFTAPGSTGGSAILDYTATSSPGGITATSATSPISVTGLTNGTPYTFTVTARNAVGSGAASAASNSVTPTAPADIPVSLSGGTLTLDASGSGSGANTTFRVVNGPGGPFLEISDSGRTLGVPAGGTAVNPNTVRIPLSSVTNLTITGSNSPDTFTFDFTDGDPLPTGSIQVHGGLPVYNPPNPGDSIVVTGGSFTDGIYGTGSGGSGQAVLDSNVIEFTGLEPVDLSGSSFVNFTVNVDPTNTFVGNVITTIASVDAGVNTEITFGSSGLESTKIGAVTGTLTIEGDNVDNDYFLLKGLGTSMVGDFSVDGKGGSADVVDISDTTVTVAGLNKDFSAKADFVGLGRQSAALLVGNLVCSGDITLEADGDINGTPALWAAGGVWGTSRPVYFSNTPIAAERGSVAVGGAISKTSGADATCSIKAKAAVVLPQYGTIISTTNKLHVVLNADTDATSGGAVSIAQQNTIRSNGGNITIGGGADPTTTPAIGSTTGGNLNFGVNISASEVTSAGGNISIRGTGRGVNNGVGVNIAAQQLNGASVIDSGSGTLTIVGTGGGNFTGTSGIRLAGAANASAPLDGAAFYSAKILSSTGTISVTGITTAGNNIGITAGNWTEITSSGLANISVSGTGFGTGAGISLSPGASVSTHLGSMTATASISSAGGNVTVTADKMALNAGTGTESIATNGTGSVTLKPLTAALAIDLGSAVDTASTLEIGPLELDNVTAPTLVIGDSASGSINVSAVIAPLNFKTLALANNTTFAATGGFTSDVTSNSVYEKVNVTGTVNIAAGASFTAAPTGGYIWNGTDTFTLLDNDASDAITGTVTPAAIPNLLGSALSGIIRYNAGTNANDITIGSMSIIEGWRQTYFSSTENAGNAANSADSDSDGKSNLLEFAFGTIPTNIGSGPGDLVYTGTLAGNGTLTATGQHTTVFEPTANNVDFRALFVRRKDYIAAGLTYTPQFSVDMQSWHNSAAVPTVLADDGTWEIVSVPYIRSIGGRKARFFRMSVSIAP